MNVGEENPEYIGTCKLCELGSSESLEAVILIWYACRFSNILSSRNHAEKQAAEYLTSLREKNNVPETEHVPKEHDEVAKKFWS